MAFLRHVLATESFSQAKLDTALIEREKEVLFNQQPLSLPLMVAAAVVNKLNSEQQDTPVKNQTQNNDPFSRLGGWRGFSDYQRQFELLLNQGEEEQSYLATISNIKVSDAQNSDSKDGQVFDLTVKAVNHQEETEQGEASQSPLYNGSIEYNTTKADSYVLWLDGQRKRLQSWVENEKVHIFSDEGSGSITLIDPMAHVEGDTQAAGSLKSPMPGQVVAFKSGQQEYGKTWPTVAVIEVEN